MARTNEFLEQVVFHGIVFGARLHSFISLSEPTAVTAPDGAMAEIEKMKYSKKLDRYFVNQEQIDKEKKQVYALFYGQMDEDMKTCLAEHDDWDTVRTRTRLDCSRCYKM